MYRNASIFIEDQSGGDMSSTLTVTLEGRQVLGRDPVPVLCYAFSEAAFYASPGKTFYIIQFGKVFAVDFNVLVPRALADAPLFCVHTMCCALPTLYLYHVFFMCRCSISSEKPTAELPIR